LYDEIKKEFEYDRVIGIPVGGSIIARELVRNTPHKLVSIEEAGLIEPKGVLVVDDIVDSGRTITPWVRRGFKTASLVTKLGTALRPTWSLQDVERNIWVKFPWESEREIEDSVVRILEYIGENPSREGLRDTPSRVVRSWGELFGGYQVDPVSIIQLQAQISESAKYDQIIVLKDIEFFSHCEHHMMPFTGKAHIGYIPKDTVVGISKLARMVDCFARRLQIQERLTQQIAIAIEETLDPQGVGVIVEGKHLCMISRGVAKQNGCMTTSAMRGNFLEDKVKSEFLKLIGR